MADSSVRGRFVWHELVTPNGKGAHEFYSKAVGWKTQPWEQDATYQMFAAATGPLGASVESRDRVPEWVAYIGSTDVDATVETAKRLGAKVTTEPTSLPNAGRYAVLTDPNGATFGVHGGGEPQPEKEPQHGEFSWHELATTVGSDEAFPFYRELFGWDELGRHDMGPIGMYLLFGRNGKQLGGMFKKDDLGKPGSAYWVGYVRTPNVDQMTEDVKAARGIVLNGPMAVPGGDRIAQFEDPHGAFFAGHTLAKDVKAAPAKKAATAAAPARAAAPAKAVAPAKVAIPPAKTAVPTKAAAPSKPAAPAKAPAKPAPKLAVAKATPAPKPKPKKAAKKKAAKKKTPKKKIVKKAAKKAGKKVAKKIAKKAGKKVAKKPAKKTAKKPVKKAQRRAAKKKPAKAAKKKGKRR